MVSKLIRWLPQAFVITAFCGLVYLTVQQNYRQSANDPQIQLSQDLAANDNPVLPTENVDIAHSLAPFIIVFNSSGQPTSATARLDGKIPNLPPGVFDYVRAHGQTRITWQPQSEIRSAIVVTKSKSGFVLAGRSLREVEKRTAALELPVAAVWIITIVTTFIFSII